MWEFRRSLKSREKRSKTLPSKTRVAKTAERAALPIGFAEPYAVRKSLHMTDFKERRNALLRQ